MQTDKKPNHKDAFTKRLFFISILLVCVVMFSSFGLASNPFSNTYENQIYGGAGNPFIEFDINASFYPFSLAESHSQYSEMKIADINGNNIKNPLFFNVGDTSIKYINMFGNQVGDTIEVNLPNNKELVDFVVVKNSDSTKNIFIVVHRTFTGASFEYGVSSMEYSNGNLVETESFLSGLAEGYRPREIEGVMNLHCAEFSVSGQNRFVCGYITHGTDNLIIVRNNAVFNRGIKVNIDKPNFYRDGGFIISQFGNDIFFSEKVDSSSSFAVTSLSSCTPVDNACLISSGGVSNYQSFSNSFSISSVNYISALSVVRNGANEFVCASQRRATGSVARETRSLCVNSAGTTKTIEASGGNINRRFWSLDITGDGNNEICHDRQNIRCVLFDTPTTQVISYNTGNTQYVDSGFFNGIGFMLIRDTTNNDYRIIDENGLNRTITNSIINSFSRNNNPRESFLKLDDITGNGISDLFGASSSGSLVAFSRPQQASQITLYEPKVFGYYDPQCINEPVTFKMRECQDTLECTYFTNNPDPFERERIGTTCGGTQDYTLGSYSFTNPQVTCTNITTAGTKTISFDLYTDANEVTPAGTLTKDVDFAVTNCNIESTIINPITIGGDDGTGTTPPPTNGVTPTPIDPDRPDSLIEQFLPQSPLWKLVIGIGIILAIMVSVAQAGGRNMNPSIIAFTGVMATILVSALGFIPMYILIIIIMLMVILIIVNKFIGGTSA